MRYVIAINLVLAGFLQFVLWGVNGVHHSTPVSPYLYKFEPEIVAKMKPAESVSSTVTISDNDVPGYLREAERVWVVHKVDRGGSGEVLESHLELYMELEGRPSVYRHRLPDPEHGITGFKIVRGGIEVTRNDISPGRFYFSMILLVLCIIAGALTAFA